MKAIGNFLWFIFFGLWGGLACFLAGVVCCVTIIGIPFGIVYFRASRLCFFPFGKYVDTNYESHPVGNVIWMALGGASEAIGCAVCGAILCVTIIGIPFGKQFFKLMKFFALPYGANVI